MPPTAHRPSMSVARQLLVLQLAVLALVIAAGTVLVGIDERRDSDDATRRTVLGIAEALAGSDSTAAALRTPDPTAVLQPRTERIREATGTDFIVVMAPDRTRYTHTDPAMIGLPFSGNIDAALDGTAFTETYAGSLGPSIRAVAPILDGGQVVGLVSVGVTRARVADQFARGLPALLGLSAAALAVAAAGAVLVSRRLRRQTLGLAPDELRRLYEHHDAVLHAIGEGLIVIGTDDPARVEVVNDEARRLLGLGDGPVTTDDLPEALRVAGPDADARGDVLLTEDRVLVVDRSPVQWEGRRIATVTTLRDRTELRTVLGELDSVRGFADALRAQAHESANRLHTIVTMVELGRPEEAVAFATEELRLSQQLIDRLTASVQEPALVALLLGKINDAAERGVELTVTDDTALGPTPLGTRDLVTLVGNLVDNAIDAARAVDEPWVEVTIRQDDSNMIVEVADSGPGMSPETLARAMTRGYSTKADHHGLGLALVAQVVTRHRGTLRTEPSLGSMVVAEIPLQAEHAGGAL